LTTAQYICISADSLSKRYSGTGVDSLTGLDLSVYKAEKFGLLGPNGAGKTTLISILCGIIPQSKGHYAFFDNGKELSKHEIRMRIGFVPQEYAFYEELTSLQNMKYFGSFYGMKPKEIHERSHEIFKSLGLSNWANKKAKTFSGGIKRRLNLAIGILHNPQILFLDEPTVGADIQSKHAMLEYLNKMNKEGVTIFYTSHHLSEAESFCDRIALINKGSMVACDTMESLSQIHKTNNLKDLFILLTGKDNYDG